MPFKRDTPGGRFEFFFDFFLELRVLIPLVESEFSTLDRCSDVFHTETRHGVSLKTFPAFCEKFRLSIFVHASDGRSDFFQSDYRFFSGDTRYDHALSRFAVALPALDADRISGNFPVGDFLTESGISEVELHLAARAYQCSEIFSLHRHFACIRSGDQASDFSGVFADSFGIFFGK